MGQRRKIEHRCRTTHPTNPHTRCPAAVPTARFALRHPPAFVARDTHARVLQNTAVVAAVLALHGAALWALQNGLTERATPAALALPRVITAQLIAAATPAPAPTAAPAETPKPVPPPAEPPAPVATPAPVQRHMPPAKPRTETKAPQRRPVAKQPMPAMPLPAAPTTPAVHEPVNTAPATTSAAATPAAAAPAAAAPVPAPQTVLPSSSATYLNNTPPPYPPLSRRLGESGEVIVRVLIGTDGRAEKAQIDKSSGYERLDQAALETARDRWRYVPGTRGGVPEAMWFKIPIKFVLE
ncbi:MAG: energy transducer TonB [Burkholderiaceae bacterium]|nr:MAG: energy transducer TonB [Burkholderiaceae bacterium]